MGEVQRNLDTTDGAPHLRDNLASASSLQSKPQMAKTGTAEKPTYGQILKSSAVIGGSSVLKISIGIVRTKAMAVLLGPAGMGLMSLYSSIADLAQSIAGMGIISSGVRQIAEAVGSGDTRRTARTVAVLRRISILLGLAGAILLVGFSSQVSTLTFGNDQHAAAIALLSVAVFFRVVSDGQGALIQGMRRISDLAKMGILGALFGTFISILMVFFLHEQGIVPSLIGVAAMTIITSWWYSRQVHTSAPSMKASELGQEASALLKLGFAFMASGLMGMGASYAIRIMVLRQIGFEAAGLYQAAWTLGGLYVGLVLQAMGADFYPRLTAINKNNTECNRLVNEQAHVSLLLAGPGVIATLAFAPVVITLFYTPKFHAAVEVLRWLCLGMALRIVSWPLGFIILAKGARNFFFWSELAWTIFYMGLTWLCVGSFGLAGAGIAFFGSYIFHCLLTYLIARRLSDFRWSTANQKNSLFFLPLIIIVFCGVYVLPSEPTIGIGMSAVILSSIYSIKVLINLVSLDRIPRPVRRLLVWFRLAAACETKGHKKLETMTTLKLDNTAAEQEPLLVRTLTSIFMIYTVVYIWTQWYEGIYGWPATLDSFVPELKTIYQNINRILPRPSWF